MMIWIAFDQVSSNLAEFHLRIAIIIVYREEGIANS